MVDFGIDVRVAIYLFPFFIMFHVNLLKSPLSFVAPLMFSFQDGRGNLLLSIFFR